MLAAPGNAVQPNGYCAPARISTGSPTTRTALHWTPAKGWAPVKRTSSHGSKPWARARRQRTAHSCRSRVPEGECGWDVRRSSFASNALRGRELAAVRVGSGCHGEARGAECGAAEGPDGYVTRTGRRAGSGHELDHDA